MGKCLEIFDVMMVKLLWCIGLVANSPQEGVTQYNNTFCAMCFEVEGNVRNAISILIIIVLLKFS